MVCFNKLQTQVSYSICLHDWPALNVFAKAHTKCDKTKVKVVMKTGVNDLSQSKYRLFSGKAHKKYLSTTLWSRVGTAA